MLIIAAGKKSNENSQERMKKTLQMTATLANWNQLNMKQLQPKHGLTSCLSWSRYYAED